MLVHHAMRPDGTQATTEEVAHARSWNTAGRERRKAASSTSARPSSTAARPSSTSARPSSTAARPSSTSARQSLTHVTSREFVSTDDSEEDRGRPSTSTLPERSPRRPTPATSTGHGSRRTTPALPERDRWRLAALPERDRSRLAVLPERDRSRLAVLPERDRSRSTALPERDRPEPAALPECYRPKPATPPERPPLTVASKIEVPKRRRAREDHAGRDATPPRHASPRHTPPTVEPARPDESNSEEDSKRYKRLTPKEKPPKTTKQPPKKHIHPSSFKGASKAVGKGKEKAAPSAALGAPPPEPASSTAASEFVAPADQSRTEDKNSRPVAAIIPKTKPDPGPFVSVERDLELSSNITESESEEIPLIIDAGHPDWSDVEPDSDHEKTITPVRHRPKVELPPPPIYNEPDQPILIEDEPPAPPPESATEAES